MVDLHVHRLNMFALPVPSLLSCLGGLMGRAQARMASERLQFKSRSVILTSMYVVVLVCART